MDLKRIKKSINNWGVFGLGLSLPVVKIMGILMESVFLTLTGAILSVVVSTFVFIAFNEYLEYTETGDVFGTLKKSLDEPLEQKRFIAITILFVGAVSSFLMFGSLFILIDLLAAVLVTVFAVLISMFLLLGQEYIQEE